MIGCAETYHTVKSDYKWSKQDIACEVTWQLLHGIDWLQTRKIARNPDKYHEVNPLLGRHPSTEKVDMYFAAGAIAHVVITDHIPPKHRWFWHMISISISGLLVNQNFNIGLGIEF